MTESLCVWNLVLKRHLLLNEACLEKVLAASNIDSIKSPFNLLAI